MSFLRIPFFDAIADAKTVLIAGAGGGYDIFSGLPLYFGLRNAGKTVHLANLTFSRVEHAKNVIRLSDSLVGVTAETKSGSTIRIDQVKSADDQYAVYFHCQTDLVATFRELYPKEMTYAGNRAVIFNADDAVPEAALRHCVGLALTYHLNRRKPARAK